MENLNKNSVILAARSWGKTETFKNEMSEQVDFDLLLSSLKDINNHVNLCITEDDNLSIFFNMLAKSSTFAHFAHKELKRRIIK